MGGVQQPQPPHSNHVFAVPAVPLHPQHGGAAANAAGSIVLPSMPSHPQAAQQLAQQPAYGYANQAAYLGNMYYASNSLQPLMVPPPSPTILSYYQADPTHLMSLLGRNAYQPQAYHYDYPLPAHRVPLNYAGQPQQPQQQLFGHGHLQKNDPALVAAAAAAAAAAAQGNPGMLLTQQYTPHPQAGATPIGQAASQNNMAAAAQIVAAAAAAAAASGQYVQQPAVNGAVAGFPGAHASARFEVQDPAAYASGAGLQLQQQVDGLYQPARRASSFTNLALLQQSSFDRS
ncbi:hypothetical protein H4R21_006875, partial [Coemansia helicoidea]